VALIIHREDSVRKGREIAEKMKELVPRQMFDVAIQACIGVKVIARTNVKALRPAFAHGVFTVNNKRQGIDRFLINLNIKTD
jgi:translation elongation factor EF-4